MCKISTNCLYGRVGVTIGKRFRSRLTKLERFLRWRVSGDRRLSGGRRGRRLTSTWRYRSCSRTASPVTKATTSSTLTTSLVIGTALFFGGGGGRKGKRGRGGKVFHGFIWYHMMSSCFYVMSKTISVFWPQLLNQCEQILVDRQKKPIVTGDFLKSVKIVWLWFSGTFYVMAKLHYQIRIRARTWTQIPKSMTTLCCTETIPIA